MILNDTKYFVVKDAKNQKYSYTGYYLKNQFTTRITKYTLLKNFFY